MLALDPRGSGQSEKPDLRYTGELVAQDVCAVLDHADVSAAHVVGLSMGGLIAQEVAIR